MAGPVTIDWGDGTPKQDGPEQGTVTHKYDDQVSGEQTITVCSKDDPSKCTTVKFTPGSGQQPGGELKVTAAEDTTDATRMTVTAKVDNTGQGPVKVDWGDGSAAVDGPETGNVTYKYPRPGQYTITATDADAPDRKGTVQVTVPFGPVTQQPKVTAEADTTDATGRTVKASWTGFPEGSVAVDFGDGTPAPAGQVAPAGTLSHQYAATVSGAQTITVTSEVDTSKKATATFTPQGGSQPGGQPTVTAESDTTDTTGRTVKASWKDFPTGKVTVDFGDGTPAQDGDGPAGTLTHQYAATVSGAQTITVTSETDASKKATATFTPQGGSQPGGQPTVTAEADTTDTTGRTVKASWKDFPTGTVAVDFGDGTPVQKGQAAPAGTLTHQYADTVSGAQTITVTSETDTSKKATATFTPKDSSQPGGQPTVTAESDTTDTTGRTVKASWKDFPTGKVTVDFGDGTPAQDGDGPAGTASHQYAATVSGEQTITVTSAADTSKKATATFTPKDSSEPGGQPTVTAEADTTDTTGRTVKASWKDFPTGTVAVDFGDGTPVQKGQAAPAGTLTHQYADTVSGAQTITVTSETDASKKATATFTPQGGSQPGGQPTVTAEADTTDTTGRTAKASWKDFPTGKVSVDFGDKTTAVDGDGPAGTASHQYADTVSGEQTITVTSAADASKKATATFTPKDGSQPGGVKVDVAEDTSDTTTRRSVLVTVDNGGKPVSVDFGDKTTAVDNAGDGKAQSKHTYAADGTFTVTATDKADATRKGMADVKVPFTGGPAPAPAPARARRYRS